MSVSLVRHEQRGNCERKLSSTLDGGFPIVFVKMLHFKVVAMPHKRLIAITIGAILYIVSLPLVTTAARLCIVLTSSSLWSMVVLSLLAVVACIM